MDVKKTLIRMALVCLMTIVLLALLSTAVQAQTIEAYGKEFDDQATILDLGKTKVTDFEELKALLRRMPNLEQVDMFDTRMERDVMAELTQEFPQIHFGWTLRVGKYRVRTDATAFSTLRKVDEKPRLKSSSYEPLQYCYQIRALDLGHSDITDISFLSGLTQLEYLILADGEISDISPLANLKSLTYLELFMNDLTDLTPLLELPNLTDLNLCQMELKDVSPLYEMKQLKRLWISRRKPAFTEEEMQTLREALPDCEINFTVVSCTGEGWRSHPRWPAVKNTFRSQSFIEWTQEERDYIGNYPYKDWIKE